jgi:hypothetical protein
MEGDPVSIRFFVFRSAIVVAVLSSIAIFTDLGKLGVCGILLGGILALYRLNLQKRILAHLMESNSGKKAILFQILSLSFVLGLLIVTCLLDLRLFIGVTAGLLIIPLLICINAVTEWFGITHNQWGQKEG